MKKLSYPLFYKLNLFFILLTFPILCFSQGKSKPLQIGIKLNPGLTLISKDSYYTSTGYKPFVAGSLQLGMRVHKIASNLFGFGSEALIHYKTVGYNKRNPDVSTICFSGNCKEKDEAYFHNNFNSSSVDMNLYSTLHSGKGYGFPYLVLGISSSLLIKGNYKYNQWTSNGLTAKESWHTAHADFTPFSLGGIAGAGVKLRIFNIESMIECRYSFYPADHVKGVNSKINMLNFGYTFYMNSPK